MGGRELRKKFISRNISVCSSKLFHKHSKMTDQIFVENRESAMQNRIKTFAIVNVDHIDIIDFLDDAFFYFDLHIRENLLFNRMFKVHTNLKLIFSKIIITDDGGEKTENETIYINSKTKIVNEETDLEKFYKKFVKKNILKTVEEVIIKGSGFTLSEIKELSIQLNYYQPLVGSSYIKLPDFLKNKKAIINVKNYDNKCFKYAILSALYPASKNADRLSKYAQHFNKLNFDGINFPVDIKQISKFEQKNPEISVNIYTYNAKCMRVETLRMTKTVKANHIHLMLIKENNVSHYCWIKDLSKLLSSQTSNNNHRKFYCDRCLNHFMTRERLEKHYNECVSRNDAMMDMPTKDNCKIKFQNFKNQLHVPFIIYADIEAYLKEPDDQFSQSTKTKGYEQHVPYSIGYYFKSMHDNTKSYYKSNRGRHCIDWFVQELKKIEEYVFPILNNIEPIKISHEDEQNFKKAKKCHICNKKFNKDDVIVRDHSHLFGDYRGPAHQSCNLNYQETRSIPVVFHNLSNYDAHFIISKIATGFEGNISVIPINDERYISFTKTVNPNKKKVDFKDKIQFRFIDSFRFMSSSLDELSSFLPAEKKTILYDESSKCGFSIKQTKMLEKKGVFPYSFVTSMKTLNDNNLPPRSAFYNKLNESNISKKKYQFAQDVWRIFDIKTLGEYSDLYLQYVP